MRTVSLREAQSNLPTIIRDMLARGETVEIIDSEQANTPLATLSPHQKPVDADDVGVSRAQGLAMIRQLRAEIGGTMTSQAIRQAIGEGRL